MSKRCNGEGSIFKESSGRYRIAVTKTINGKKVRRTKVAHTRADAAAKLDELRQSKVIGGPKTVAAFLAEWIKDTVKPNSEENTIDGYQRVIRNHIDPHVGAIALVNFDKSAALKWLSALEESVGSRTKQLAFVVLSSAMADAAERREIEGNPLANIKKPSHETDPIYPFSLIESKSIIKAAEGHRYHALIHLAFAGGFRQCELFGLEWDRILWNVNKVRIDQAAVNVNGTTILKKPKTKGSCRTVSVPPSVMASLQRHYRMMKDEGFSDISLVFPSNAGTISTRGGFRKWTWVPLLQELEIAHRGFHHVRHTFATLALGANVPINVLSEQLGHAKITTTYEIYGHILEDQRVAANTALNQLFA